MKNNNNEFNQGTIFNQTNFKKGQQYKVLTKTEMIDAIEITEEIIVIKSIFKNGKIKFDSITYNSKGLLICPNSNPNKRYILL